MSGDLVWQYRSSNSFQDMLMTAFAESRVARVSQARGNRMKQVAFTS